MCFLIQTPVLNCKDYYVKPNKVKFSYFCVRDLTVDIPPPAKGPFFVRHLGYQKSTKSPKNFT